VVSRSPFIIRLTVPSAKHTRPVILSLDTGAKRIGLAAVATYVHPQTGEVSRRVLYQGEVALRDDISWRMDRRRNYRSSRRSRNRRHHKPKFDDRNPTTCKVCGRNARKGHTTCREHAYLEHVSVENDRRGAKLPPSIRSKVETTVKAARRVAGFLPLSLIRVEVATFDTQAIRANAGKLPSWAYQRGPQYGFENVKMYVRHRDNYTCQYCGKKFPERLEIDHIVPRSRGGSDRPDNLVCACHECNQTKGNKTAEEFGHPEVHEKAKRPLRMAAHTQAGKTATRGALEEIAPVEITYGFITKLDREAMGLPKTHYYDAVAIASGGEKVSGLDWYEAGRAVQKGNYRQRKGDHSHLVASLPYEVFDFRQWDKVELPNGKVGFVKGRRSSGYFAISDLDGNLIAPSIVHKRLRLIERASTLLSERRALDAVSPPHS